MATELIGTYMWVVWMEIAHDQLYRAGRARVGIETSKGLGPDLLRYLDGELVAGMISVSASAHAIDAFYGSVRERADLGDLEGKWEENKTKRPSRILETFKRSFEIGALQGRWAEDFDWLFDLRDSAVHHESKPHEAQLHPTEKTTVSLEHASYTLEHGNKAVTLAREVIGTCARSPRAEQKRIVEWLPEVLEYVERVEQFDVSGPAPYPA